MTRPGRCLRRADIAHLVRAAAGVTGRNTFVIVDADIRPALQSRQLSLVRPDGYLACSSSDASAIGTYLRGLS